MYQMSITFTDSRKVDSHRQDAVIIEGSYLVVENRDIRVAGVPVAIQCRRRSRERHHIQLHSVSPSMSHVMPNSVQKGEKGSTRPNTFPAYTYILSSFLYSTMICAKFRDNSKLRTKRIDKELSRTCCIRARDSEYQQRLSQLIVGTAMEKRPSLKADLLNKKQIPYGTMPNIVKRLRSEGITTTRTTLTATFAADFDIDTWKQYIEENFDNLYALYRHTPKPPTRSGATVMKEEIFAVPIPFNRLLNEELGHEETTVFKNLLYTAARQVTHSIATITMAARIQVIHYASHGFKESSSSRHIPITNLCPVSSVRDTTQLLDGRMIPVSPPDTNLQQMMNNDDDIKQYLDFNHLSFMMNNINKHSNATTHRTWRKCLEQVNLNPSYIMSGKNKLKASEIRLLSTSVNNMWRKSKMYWNVLGHLSRLLIRLHLAPKRELKRYTKISGAKARKYA